MRLPRAAGILLHPTSLPGRFGIGDLGPEALRFVEFLASVGQRWWQMLPLGPTGAGNSPYQSYSTYAGNPLLISPEALADDGWLSPDDWRHDPAPPDAAVDFDAVRPAKDRLLRLAFERFTPDDPAFAAFADAQAHWLDDYALFMALKDEHGGAAWYDWAPKLATRDRRALGQASKKLARPTLYHKFVQYAFARQWSALRAACARHDIGLIGDLPIFVALDSADVWARPELFQLDSQLRPTFVAGVPPDYFAETGQLWGNPLYKWEAHAAESYAWWIGRLRAATSRVDLVRLDHFRGFQAYWRVPAGAATAVGGHWAPGPGDAFFQALRAALGGLPVVAEDLGDITPDVIALRDRFELPGMRVLQFGFAGEPGTDYHLPHRHVPHCIAYTGTHDNDTALGWFSSGAGPDALPGEGHVFERQFALCYLASDGSTFHWDLIRAALASVADTALVPLQDVLGLDSRGRMNVPGQAEGNWGWRLRPGQLDPRSVARLADLTAVYSRWNGALPERFLPPKTRAITEPPLVAR